MAQENPINKKSANSDLDKSINIGLDQFGRFMRRAWLWIAIIVLLIIFFSSGKPIMGINPTTMFQLLLQLAFAFFFLIFQFVGMFWFLGRPRLYWVMPGETGVTFDDYKGNPEVLESARRIVTLLRGVKEFEEMGGKPVRGLLLSGPPGTGKSYLAQCMSTEAGVPFAYASASSFRAMFIGMDVLMIANLYRKARRLAREFGGCVIFFDEIDAIATSRSSRAPGMGMGMGGMFGMNGSGGLNQLLMEMDPPNIETGWFKKILRTLGLYHGRAQSEPVLTIGATNIPDSLDAALLRPGRFDRRVHVDAPTDKYRPEVIEYYLKKIKHDPSISISALSARLVEYSAASIKHVVNEATIIAHFDGRDSVKYKDLVEAQDIHEFGMRQLAELTPIERRRLAYHEAGHTVAAYYLLDRHFPAFVTLHHHGDMQGAEAFAAWRPKETVVTRSKEEVLVEIQIALASRAAEELFLNVQLDGVGGDLMSATSKAAAYIGVWGMDGTLTSIMALRSADGNGPMPRQLMDRVEELLQSQLGAVKRLFMDHKEAVIALAEALIEKDELVADEIKELIENADARSASTRVFSEFTPLLEATSSTNGNGHSNGNGNGGYLSAPRQPSETLNFSPYQIEPQNGSQLFNSDEDHWL